MITSDRKVLALSWNIATDPQLYRVLAANPYSQAADLKISERFPNFHTDDVIKAIILAEPESRYDINFNRLEEAPKSIELRWQKDWITKTNNKLTEYLRFYTKELNHPSKELVYNLLLKVVFETSNLEEIQKRYSLEQRRYFKLAIIDFIKNRRRRQFLKQSIIAGAAALSFTSIFLISLVVIQTMNQSNIKSKQVLGAHLKPLEFPVHLVIPGIKVDTSIQEVGVADDGSMETPNNVTEVGWFDLGPNPGATGSAVIDGHFDGKDGESAVFNHLNKLKPGDKIFVINNLGNIIVFVVRESREFVPGYSEEVFRANDENAHLNLITCDGTWDGTKKSYTKRLVVFTDKMP